MSETPIETLGMVLEARRKREEHMIKVIEARNKQIDRLRVIVKILIVVQVLVIAMVIVGK
jgi:type IV secretory pathway component VirB8